MLTISQLSPTLDLLRESSVYTNQVLSGGSKLEFWLKKTILGKFMVVSPCKVILSVVKVGSSTLLITFYGWSDIVEGSC